MRNRKLLIEKFVYQLWCQDFVEQVRKADAVVVGGILNLSLIRFKKRFSV